MLMLPCLVPGCLRDKVIESLQFDIRLRTNKQKQSVCYADTGENGMQMLHYLRYCNTSGSLTPRHAAL